MRVRHGASDLLGAVGAPTRQVAIRADCRGDHVVVELGGGSIDVPLDPADTGHHVGMVANGPASRFADFAYLTFGAGR